MVFKISTFISSSEYKINILKNLNTIALNSMTLTVHCDHVGQAVNRTTKKIFSLFISVTVFLSFLTLTGMVTVHCCCIDNTCIKTTNPIIPGQMFAFQQQYVVL